MVLVWIPAYIAVQRLPEEEAVIADLFKAAKNLAEKALNDTGYDERLKSVEEYLKTSNFSSKLIDTTRRVALPWHTIGEFFSGTAGIDLSAITPATGFKALKSDSVNYVHIPPMSEAELVHKNMSGGIRTERQMVL